MKIYRNIYKLAILAFKILDRVEINLLYVFTNVYGWLHYAMKHKLYFEFWGRWVRNIDSIILEEQDVEQEVMNKRKHIVVNT